MAKMRRYRKELADALREWDKAGDVEGYICGLIEGTTIEHGALSASRGIVKKQAGRKKKP